MASNIIQTDGAFDLRYTTTGAVTVGSLLAIGNFPGVAVESATGSGQIVAVKCGCEARLSKKAAAGTAVTVGGPVTYTTTGGANLAHGTSVTGATIIGYGTRAAATGATSCYVRLIYPSGINASFG